MKELICIGCPIGCLLKVEVQGDEIRVGGNGCKRGETYAQNEIRCPKRPITSTVALLNGSIRRLSVRTAQDVPKDKIFACMEEIHKIRVSAPVHIGDVVLENCAGTGVDVIATKNVESVREEIV